MIYGRFAQATPAESNPRELFPANRQEANERLDEIIVLLPFSTSNFVA